MSAGVRAHVNRFGSSGSSKRTWRAVAFDELRPHPRAGLAVRVILGRRPHVDWNVTQLFRAREVDEANGGKKEFTALMIACTLAIHASRRTSPLPMPAWLLKMTMCRLHSKQQAAARLNGEEQRRQPHPFSDSARSPAGTWSSSLKRVVN